MERPFKMPENVAAERTAVWEYTHGQRPHEFGARLRSATRLSIQTADQRLLETVVMDTELSLTPGVLESLINSLRARRAAAVLNRRARKH